MADERHFSMNFVFVTNQELNYRDIQLLEGHLNALS